ncbi:hypothetical protein A4D02_09115 [Niastella koreensis]|nr:hypothetical protein A4D02_09115 [Niastella koreensis]
MAKLGVDFIFIIDDGSLDLAIEESAIVDVFLAKEGLPAQLSKKINIITFGKHLGRPSIEDYPGWWRSFTWSVKIAEKYNFKKIVHVESDFYIISDRLMSFINSLDSGWTSLYSSHYEFCETGIQIICQDNFPALEKIRSTVEASNYKVNQVAEHFLPFTSVCKEFNGDRLGDLSILNNERLLEEKGTNELDFYGNLPTYVKPLTAPDLHKVIHSLGSNINMDREVYEDTMFRILQKHNLIVAPV